MRGIDGIELCERIVANRPDVPVLVLTAFGSLDSAIAAIRAGAYDFINKPVQLDVLVIAIERAAGHRRLREEVKRLRIEVGRSPRFDELVGQSPPMQTVYGLVERVAATDATVLITGESGTGKEVVARAIHARSARRGGPLVAINCAAMPESLLESELFGHAKGAFTDARTAEPGLFAQANRGTILLDEVGDMPLGLQPKLLRVLQERTVRPVGGRAEVPIDVRVVASTNRDLESAIEEGRFRQDLYYRINVVNLALPPLRARGGDILPLAQHFLLHFAKRAGKEVSGIASPAAEKLLAYMWPGNVRELQNSIERAVALTRFEQIVVDDLPEKIRDYRRSHVIVASDDPSELVPLEEVERRYLARVMEVVSGNKTAAARILGVDRKRLYRMLARLEVDASKAGA
jgi:two-component system response regulator HydG